MESNTRIA
jgi:4,5-DOPA dioxygenase extradiol